MTRKLFVGCQLPLNSLGNLGTERAHVWVGCHYSPQAWDGSGGGDRRPHPMSLLSPNAWGRLTASLLSRPTILGFGIFAKP